MSISLNNHESRIKVLENGGAGSWSKGSNANGNWVKESKTGLLIQWNCVYCSRDQNKITLPTSYKNDTYSIMTVQNHRSGDAETSALIPMIKNKKSTTFEIRHIHPQGHGVSSWMGWFAIGYLISDRILNYAYACKSLLFTPLIKWRCE